MNRSTVSLTVIITALIVAFAAWTDSPDRVFDTTTPNKTITTENYSNTPDEYLPYGNFTKPYRYFFREPLQYRGYGRHIPEPDLKTLGSVRIGFLGPIYQTVSVATGGASHEEPMGKKMLQGTTLAIEQANARGGYRGTRIPYELCVHNDNGLWGASGDEIIDLAYKEKVWGILGTIDGANSHIAIRVALKCELLVMNTGDTDPTFVETNIPWVFRCISDDRQMCYLLADYAYKKLGLKRVAALRANNRYGRMSIDEFRDASTRLGHPFITELNYKLGDTDFSAQIERIKGMNPDAVMTYGDSQESALILKQMREMGLDCWFVGSDRMVSKEFTETAGKENLYKVIAGYPYNPTSEDAKYKTFVREFTARFNEKPEAYAAHAYDGVQMVIQAIEKAGLNRALIRDELARMETHHGVTGHKIFDPIFSDISPACLAIIENGEFAFYTKEEALGES